MEKKITDILKTGQWKGKRCFILAGGPSLEGFDFTPLKNELTIGVNKSFLFNPTISYFMDNEFYKIVTEKDPELVEKWKQYNGVKVFLQPSDKKSLPNDIYVVGRRPCRCISLDLNAGIFPGSNSGFGAIMLSVVLGSTEIYLCGFSFKLGVNKKTHWHKGYANQNTSAFEKRLQRFKNELDGFAERFKSIGINVYNCTPDSELRNYEKRDLAEVLGQIG